MAADRTKPRNRLEFLAALEPNRVTERLRVKETASEEGVKKLPPEDATDPDAHERGILAHFENLLDEERGRCQDQLDRIEQSLNARRNEIQPSSDASKLVVAASSLEASHRDLLQREKPSVTRLRREQERKLRFLRFFQLTNGLEHRAATYPESALHHFGWVAVIAAIEWFALSSFYINGSDFGALGGIAIAFGFSFVNLILAVGAGLFARYLNHHDARKLAAGGAAALLCLALFLFLTLLAAHYRVAVEDAAAARLAALNTDSTFDPERFRAAQTAWESFMENPLGLGDAMAWVVVVFAIAFGMFAVFKGYTADDPYPGYKQVDLASRRAESEYIDETKALRAQQTALFQKAHEEQARVVAETKRAIEAFDKDILTADGVVRDFAQSVDVANRNCNTVIQTYRQTNSFVAATRRPAYFATRVSVAAALETPLNHVSQELRDAQRRLHQDRQELDKRYVECHETLRQNCEACAARLQEILDQIERDIRAEIDREPSLLLPQPTRS